MHLDDRQAALAQAEDVGAGAEADTFQHYLVAVCDQLRPVLASRLLLTGVEQGEVDAGLVAADEPGPFAVEATVVRVVLVAFLARRQAAELALRRVGIKGPGLAGGLAVEQEDQLALGARAVAVQEEAAVAFLEHLFGALVAEAMAVQLVRPVGVVELAEKQRAVVVGPGHAAVAVVEGQGAYFAAGEVLDVELVDLVAAGVQAVGEQRVVRADAEGTERQVAAVGQRIGIEQQLLGGVIHRQRAIRRARAAVVARVFVAGGGALVVQPRAPRRRQGQVGLADAPLDLLEQLLAQGGLFGQLLFQIGVLRLEVVEHIGGVAIFQPGIGIGGGFATGDGGLMGGHALSWLAAGTLAAHPGGKGAIISAPSLPPHARA
ncbi:hypothetical protein D3C76_605320 [compost metagenome]